MHCGLDEKQTIYILMTGNSLWTICIKMKAMNMYDLIIRQDKLQEEESS